MNRAELQPCKVRSAVAVAVAVVAHQESSYCHCAGPCSTVRGVNSVLHVFCHKKMARKKSPRDLDTTWVLICRWVGPETLHFQQAPG